MNVEMLIAEHGSFEKCPTKITGKILEKDSASMTVELRDKLRYLSHVPVTCAFEVVELEVVNVSAEVLAQFGAQLEARRLRRNRRARDERRREKRIQVEESKMMGSYRSSARAKKSLKLESDVHFPGIIGNAENNDLRRVSESSGASVDTSGGMRETVVQHPPPASSFAKMLRQGAGGVARQQHQPPRMMSFPVLGAPVRVRQASESSEGPGEDYVPPPPTQSIGDALASALQRASITEDPVNGASAGNNGGSGGKKKGKKTKGKKIDLFGSAPRPML